MSRQAEVLRLFEQRISARRIHPKSSQAHQYVVGAQHAFQHCGGAQDWQAVKDHAFCFVDPTLLVTNRREEAEREGGSDRVWSRVLFSQCNCVQQIVFRRRQAELLNLPHPLETSSIDRRE